MNPTVHMTFDQWYAKLLEIAAANHWCIENPDEWRSYYDRLYSPEQAFRSEMGDHDVTDDPAGY